MLTFKNQTLPSYREENIDGVDYLVVPGIPIQEQVLNYYFVNAEEIGHFVASWNGIPVVINHPSDNHGSANVPQPDVPVVGTFYNAAMDGKKLTGEFWINLLNLRAVPDGVGAKIESAIRKNRTLEISTGYFADETQVEGEPDYNGVKYTAIHQNIHPDHIAILPDAIGACSVEDGCGLPRLNCSQNCAACACASKDKDKSMTDKPKEDTLLDKIRALLNGGAQTAMAQNAADPVQSAEPITPEPVLVHTNEQTVVLNQEEYSMVRAYVSLSADMGGVENIKKLLLLMQASMDAQVAKEAADATARADELAAVATAGTGDLASADTAMTNQAAPRPAPVVAADPVNYAGAVASTAVQNISASQGLGLPSPLLSGPAK